MKGMKVDASKAIRPEQLEGAIADILMGWADGEEKKFFEAIDEAADQCDDEIRKHTPVYTGEYEKNFSVERKLFEKHQYKATWNVKEPRHYFTWLLEYGHLTRDGVTRTKAIPHIKYGKKIAEQVLNEKLAKLYGGG